MLLWSLIYIIGQKKFYIEKFLVWCDNKVNKGDKSRYVYSGYGMLFDGKGEWNFGKDNSSPSHTDIHKNNLLVLGKEDTFGINGSFRTR